jgi:aerobic carbon-monoxide dehydrogenase large subunit
VAPVLTARRPAGQYRQVSILGTRVIRTEDPRFLTTGGIYTADVRLPGACHVQFVRSVVAHARVGSVDAGAARQAPGVIAVFTAADLAGLPDVPPPMAGMTNPQMSQPLLARDVVR